METGVRTAGLLLGKLIGDSMISESNIFMSMASGALFSNLQWSIAARGFTASGLKTGCGIIYYGSIKLIFGEKLLE